MLRYLMIVTAIVIAMPAQAAMLFNHSGIARVPHFTDSYNLNFGRYDALPKVFASGMVENSAVELFVSNNSNAAQVAQVLTDGQPGLMTLSIDNAHWVDFNKSTLAQNFVGQSIGSFQFELADVQQIGSFDYLNYNFSIMGLEIPEPGTWQFVLVAAVIAAVVGVILLRHGGRK